MNIKKQLKILCRSIFVLCFLSNNTLAYDLPVVNLGATSFMDGGPPAGPGFYFQEYVQLYTSDIFKATGGVTIPLPDTKLDVWVSVNQFIYLHDKIDNT